MSKQYFEMILVEEMMRSTYPMKQPILYLFTPYMYLCMYSTNSCCNFYEFQATVKVLIDSSISIYT